MPVDYAPIGFFDIEDSREKVRGRFEPFNRGENDLDIYIFKYSSKVYLKYISRQKFRDWEYWRRIMRLFVERYQWKIIFYYLEHLTLFWQGCTSFEISFVGIILIRWNHFIIYFRLILSHGISSRFIRATDFSSGCLHIQLAARIQDRFSNAFPSKT